MENKPKETANKPKTSSRLDKLESSWESEISAYTALVENVDRFGIPIRMINKTYRHQKMEHSTKNVLTRVRHLHMNYNKPPSTVQSSENDRMKYHKRLALLQTPYFFMPIQIIDSIRCKTYRVNTKKKKSNLFGMEKPMRSSEDDIDQHFKESNLSFVSPLHHYNENGPKQSTMRSVITTLIKSNFKNQIRRNTLSVSMIVYIDVYYSDLHFYSNDIIM